MKKKSAAVSLDTLRRHLAAIRQFLADAEDSGMSSASISRCYDHGVISVYRAFEEFVLNIAVVQINRDPDHLYQAVGVKFGKNPTAAQCEYLLVGHRYFDFRGYGGLVNIVKKASGTGSQLEIAVKKQGNRQCLEILLGLRNYAAHRSPLSKKAALKGMKHWEPNTNNLGRAGNWLRVRKKGQSRMERLLTNLEVLAQDMRANVKRIARRATRHGR
jgi:hypothetical protein